MIGRTFKEETKAEENEENIILGLRDVLLLSKVFPRKMKDEIGKMEWK